MIESWKIPFTRLSAVVVDMMPLLMISGAWFLFLNGIYLSDLSYQKETLEEMVQPSPGLHLEIPQ